MTIRFTRREAVITLGAALVAGSTRARAQSAGGEPITVYNAQHVSLAKQWTEAFTKATGVAVTLRNGDDTELGNQIVQEGKASPADVFLTENSPAMALVDNAGLFPPLPKDITDQVEPAFRPSSGHWIGIAARSTVFAYNKQRLPAAQLPKSIMDLATPAWKGRWGASPAGADFQAIVSAMLELEGPAATLDWLKGMKANATAYRGNGNVLKAVNAAQIDGGVIYHYYWFGDQARTHGENSNNTALHYFRHQDPGAFVSLSGGAVLASSKQPERALAFLRFITGKPGQQILRDGSSLEYAVGVGAASNPKLVPLAELDAPKVDPSKLNSKQVTDLMTQAGLL